MIWNLLLEHGINQMHLIFFKCVKTLLSGPFPDTNIPSRRYTQSDHFMKIACLFCILCYLLLIYIELKIWIDIVRMEEEKVVYLVNLLMTARFTLWQNRRRQSSVLSVLTPIWCVLREWSSPDSPSTCQHLMSAVQQQVSKQPTSSFSQPACTSFTFLF